MFIVWPQDAKIWPQSKKRISTFESLSGTNDSLEQRTEIGSNIELNSWEYNIIYQWAQPFALIKFSSKFSHLLTELKKKK